MISRAKLRANTHAKYLRECNQSCRGLGAYGRYVYRSSSWQAGGGADCPTATVARASMVSPSFSVPGKRVGLNFFFWCRFRPHSGAAAVLVRRNGAHPRCCAFKKNLASFCHFCFPTIVRCLYFWHSL